MAGGRDRASWELGRQVRESRLRESLATQGIVVPRDCPGCSAALEVLRDGAQRLVIRCAGRCGRSDGRSALAQLRAMNAALLPGFA